MKNPTLILLITFMLSCQLIKAQDIFKKHGFDKEPLTLSNGSYNEFFNNDEVVQIGTVLLNTKTSKVVDFIDEDTTKAAYLTELSSRWLSIDPLAAKYFQFSPYCYVANNPIIFIDPDGRRIEYAKGVSEEFKQQFSATVKYLNKHGAGGVLKKLQDHETVVYITEGNNKSSFSPSKMTITWDSNMGMFTNNGIEVSSATILNHEADHAQQELYNPDQKKTDKNTPDSQYGNKEEKRVIEGTEQETAKKLGEIKKGEVTRTDHGGTGYETKGPTTTEWKNEIIVTSKKNEEKK